MKIFIVTFTIRSNCSVVLLCYFSLYGVICCASAWTFSSTPKIARWRHCNADNFKTLKDNYTLIRVLYACSMTEYVGKILLWNSSDCWENCKKIL